MFRDIDYQHIPIPKPKLESLLNHAQSIGCEEMHVKFDEDTGLLAIIVIHSTQRGPALGGCRFYTYPTVDVAIEDAIQLAHSMTYKAAINDLKFGGGKSVILKPEHMPDRPSMFQAFGRFINALNGKYIVAMDLGTTEEDMDAIARESNFVASTSGQKGDPSPYTAKGVCEGMLAAVQFKSQKDTLEGIHVAIQGLGHVGYNLAKELSRRGAIITAGDTNDAIIRLCKKEFPVSIVSPEKVHSVECDIFAPCAMGGILNARMIAEINAPIIAGAANNQLESNKVGTDLFNRNILYAPDYVINAGGLIYATGKYNNVSTEEIVQHLHRIPENLHAIFKRSQKEHRPTNEIADEIALSRI